MKENRKPVETVDKNESFYEKERFCQTIKRQCSNTWKHFNQSMVDAKVYETLDCATTYIMSNPILLAVCLAIIAAVAIPLLLFVLFATINVAFAFASFVVIEVTVLTIGATVLCFMLFCVISTITVMGFCVVLTYYVISYMLSLIKNIKTSSM